MNILREITEKDLGLTETERYEKPYVLRKAARAVLVREDGMVALQHITRHGVYKLPGGGVDHGETIEEALTREIMEEAGCKLSVTREVGVIIEYLNTEDMLQISYCFLASVVGEIAPPELTPGEIDQGMIPMWVSLDEAIHLVGSNPGDEETRNIPVRDLAFLKEAKKLLAQ